jgi:hypothetical protein
MDIATSCSLQRLFAITPDFHQSTSSARNSDVNSSQPLLALLVLFLFIHTIALIRVIPILLRILLGLPHLHIVLTIRKLLGVVLELAISAPGKILHGTERFAVVAAIVVEFGFPFYRPERALTLIAFDHIGG